MQDQNMVQNQKKINFLINKFVALIIKTGKKNKAELIFNKALKNYNKKNINSKYQLFLFFEIFLIDLLLKESGRFKKLKQKVEILLKQKNYLTSIKYFKNIKLNNKTTDISLLNKIFVVDFLLQDVKKQNFYKISKNRYQIRKKI